MSFKVHLVECHCTFPPTPLVLGGRTSSFRHDETHLTGRPDEVPVSKQGRRDGTVWTEPRGRRSYFSGVTGGPSGSNEDISPLTRKGTDVLDIGHEPSS